MTKAERRRFPPGDDLMLDGGTVFTVEDWKDFYDTLRAFNARVRERHGNGTAAVRDLPPPKPDARVVGVPGVHPAG